MFGFSLPLQTEKGYVFRPLSIYNQYIYVNSKNVGYKVERRKITDVGNVRTLELCVAGHTYHLHGLSKG